MSFFKTRVFLATAFFLLGFLTAWIWSGASHWHFQIGQSGQGGRDRLSLMPGFRLPPSTDKNDQAESGAESESGSEDPFEELRNLQQQMMNSVQGTAGMGFETPELQDQGSQYLMEIELHGMKPRNFNVQVEKGQLLLEGALGSAEENTSVTSRFSKSFPVPPDVDADRIQVETKNDRITVTLPKKKDH